MFPPAFFGPPREAFGPRSHHSGPFHRPGGPHHHHPPCGTHHGLMGPPFHPWGHHHNPRGPHHGPMGPHHRPRGPFGPHLGGPHHGPWGPHHRHQSMSSWWCPLRGPRDHHRHSFMKSMFAMAAACKLAHMMMHVATDYDWLGNFCVMDDEDEPKTSGDDTQETPTADESEQATDNQQKENDCEAERDDLWTEAEKGKRTSQVFVGPYAETEVKVVGEGQDGVKVEASHVHGEDVVASMMKHLPAPFASSYTVSHNHDGPWVIITATKEDEMEINEDTPQPGNLDDKTNKS